MGRTYRAYLPEQDFLLPPSLGDWLYEEEERGQPPYHPRMMTKILIYGYCVKVFSSRRIQKKLNKDIGFRVLAAGNQPDFRTISDFRKQHLAGLQGLFDQVLQIALQAGMSPRIKRCAFLITRRSGIERSSSPERSGGLSSWACQGSCLDRGVATLASPCSAFALTVTVDSVTAAIVAGDKHDDSSDVLPIAATSKPNVVDKRIGYVNLPTDDAGVAAA
jgi:hypothetical protein